MNNQTVRLEISVEISERDDDYNTGYTIAEWNALTDEERNQVYRNAWDTMTQNDHGGVHVLTEGAEGL